MNTTILLCNCNQLDNNYNHSLTFNSKETQFSYFSSKCVQILNNNNYQRKNENEIRVDKTLNELRNVNYCVIDNDDNTRYFYFVLDKIYENDYCTTLYLQLDVIQTYLFELNFTSCLIERQHINNWVYNGSNKYPNLAYSQEQEGIEVGEYIVNNIYTIYDYSDKGSYIITSSDILGLTDKSEENSTNSSNENYKSYNLDTNGLVMIKHFEGFRAYSYDINDGTYTTGYGFTSEYQPNAYNSFLANPTEENGSIILSNLIKDYFGIVVTNAINECVDGGYIDSSWLSQNKFNALVSYSYQYGNIIAITDLIKEGYTDEEIYNWFMSEEQTYLTRRQFEGEVFFNNVYGDMTISDGEGGVITDNDGKGYVPEQNQ